jgi:hypothetical protein
MTLERIPFCCDDDPNCTPETCGCDCDHAASQDDEAESSGLASATIDGYVSRRGQSLRIAPIAADLRFGSVRVKGRACSIAEQCRVVRRLLLKSRERGGR